jgi:hypothetical protein
VNLLVHLPRNADCVIGVEVLTAVVVKSACLVGCNAMYAVESRPLHFAGTRHLHVEGRRINQQDSRRQAEPARICFHPGFIFGLSAAKFGSICSSRKVGGLLVAHIFSPNLSSYDYSC